VSARRGRPLRGLRVTSVAHLRPQRRGRIVWILLAFLVVLGATTASADTTRGRIILTAVQGFLLFYSGVFALVALTAAVGVGLAAADRIVMGPAGRVISQGVHRAVSLAALAFLAIHIATEILAHRSRAVDAFVPFLAHGRTFYIGLGTIASDLVVILVVTGIARGRFANRRPWTWRAIHASAYLCWLLALVHGLLAGRTAKPYVDWSYGACVAAVGLALLFRLVATARDRRETAPHPVPDHASAPIPAAMSVAAQAGLASGLSAVPRARGQQLALPPAPPGPSTAPEDGPDPQDLLAAYAVTPYPDDPCADAAYPDGRYPAAAYPDGPYPAAAYPGDRYPADAYPHRPYPACPADAYPHGPYPDGAYPDAAYADDPHSNAGYADAAYPDDPDPAAGYADEPYQGDPYAGAAYAEAHFPDGPYADAPYAGPPYPYDQDATDPPNLWLDHPSGPMRGVPGKVRAIPPARGRERS
jgi:DMSO/TMAO reductase YedYZ heme-binding membrane subunit